MKGLKGGLLTWAVLLVFLAPVVLIMFGPIYVAPFGRALYIALLLASVLTGGPGLVLFGIAWIMRLRRGGKPARIEQLLQEQRLNAVGLGLFAATMTFALATNFTPLATIYAAAALAYVLWSVPSSTRRQSYRSAVVVRCTPEDAFALVSNPRNWPRYFPQLEVDEPVDAPSHVGSIIHVRVREGRQVVAADERVTELEAGRRFATAVVTPHANEGLYEFTPVADGTEIAYSFHGEMTVAQAVLGGAVNRNSLLKRMISQREEGMQRIKQLLEAPEPITV